MTPAFVNHFDACLGCMACVTSCPSGVQYAPLIEATRAQIDRRYPRSWQRSPVPRRDLRALSVSRQRLRIALMPLAICAQRSEGTAETAKSAENNQRFFSAVFAISAVPSDRGSRCGAMLSLAPDVTWRLAVFVDPGADAGRRARAGSRSAC